MVSKRKLKRKPKKIAKKKHFQLKIPKNVRIKGFHEWEPSVPDDGELN